MNEAQQNQISPKYKFKELKTYSSLEWLAENKKKYRQVFDASNTGYIYAELSLYNKEFDRENWDINVKIKCFNVEKKKLVCTLDVNKTVSKNNNIIYIREGWGNRKKGVFWKKGNYMWEVWIDDKKVAVKYFFIENLDLDFLNVEDEPLIRSIKLYEGHFDDVLEAERRYLKVFSANQTRYVHVELNVNNIFLDNSWNGEFIVKFFNEVRELKGQIIKLQKLSAEDAEIQLTAGWGSNVKGSWGKGKYTAEVVFMDRLVGRVNFEVGEDSVEGLLPLHLVMDNKNLVIDPEIEDDGLNFQDVFLKLDALIGLDEIKSEVKNHAEYLKYIKLRKEKGFKEDDQLDLHSLFIGNPGTGKTSVAKMMGLLYKKLGLLSKGHVLEVDRSDLVGEYIGQTAPKVKTILKKARGGVLFIDEAYSLARAMDDKKDFGKEVIEILVKEMSNGVGDVAIIAAGYPKEMKHFIESNPGLRSRFKHKFEFRDYSPNELLEIADYASKEREVILTGKSKAELHTIIQEEYRNRDKNFGNARFVNDILDRAKINMGLRIMSRKSPDNLSKKTISTILPIDFANLGAKRTSIMKPELAIDHDLLIEAMSELNQLVGMSKLKSQIEESINLIKYYKETGQVTNSAISMHTVFIGNPGTGKTTVARILSRVYKALGILERGHLIETDRQGLVAGFIGQTAIKTNERIDEAKGGVLYIDEAYSLTPAASANGDYGHEAIQTLLKRMEDDRGEFFVYVAGYPENMKQFLQANPGLSSRFDNTLYFEDYSENELFEISVKMLKDKNYKLSRNAKVLMKKQLHDLYVKRDKYFGNAREMRRIAIEVIKNHNIRVGKIELALRTTKMLKTIEEEDILKSNMGEPIDLNLRRRIGYH